MGSEIKRSLVSVQKVEDVQPIEGADMIEVATVLGWEVVVKKGEFQVGDLAVYFEIDSFLPRRPEWEFLEKSCLRKMGNLEGLRLRTIRLRGQTSQGLLLPLDVLVPESNWIKLEVGDDLTDFLGVVKWDPPLPANLAGNAKGNFPSFLRKTDQERIQNCFRTLQNKWIDMPWEVTVKLDGSSFTAYFNDGNFGVCSRNLDLAEDDNNAFWQAAKKYDLSGKLASLGRNIAIQAELMGPGVQGNRENLSELDIYVFDVFDIDNQTYLNAHQRYDIVNTLGLKHTTVLEIGSKISKETTVKDLLVMAEGPSLNHKIREGIVFKSLSDPNVSFKAISNTFLSKEKD